MAILLTKALTWLSTSLFGLFGAWKVFFVGSFMTAIGVTIYGLLLYGAQEILSYMLEALQGLDVPEHPGAYNFTGFAGWFASVMKVPECLSFIISIVTLKWTLKKIPFLKW